MTAPEISPETRAEIEQGIRLAWSFGEAGDYGREEQELHYLHAYYGTPAVRAVALSLLAMLSPTEVRP